MEPSSRGKLPALAFDLVSRRRHWLLDSRAAGRLLLQDVSDREHECFGDRPRGGPSSAASPAGDGGARSIENVPVPTVMVGVLPMPILAGQHALSVEYLLRSLQQGVLPSDTLADADRGVWRTVSRVTDPISAFNVCQAQQLAGRRLILTERGVAEQLARSTIKVQPLWRGSWGGQAPGAPPPLPYPPHPGPRACGADCAARERQRSLLWRPIRCAETSGGHAAGCPSPVGKRAEPGQGV